jgi:RNA polymerase sigma-32 factor
MVAGTRIAIGTFICREVLRSGGRANRGSFMAQYIGLDRHLAAAAKAAPFLDREEERDLAMRWHDDHDERALHRLTQAHMRLVIAVSMRFRHYGLPISDLIQEGHVGLLQAAARFDPARDVRFSTYATWWIRAAIQDFVLRNWSIVRGGTSSTQKALFFNLRRLRAKLSVQHSGSAVFDQIARTLGVRRADVELMDARFASSDLSLNAAISEADPAAAAQRLDLLADERPLPDALAEDAIDADRRIARLAEALRQLNPRELDIVRHRQLADEAATLESLGARFGISKERVRQIECRALQKLRQALTGQDADERGMDRDTLDRDAFRLNQP